MEEELGLTIALPAPEYATLCTCSMGYVPIILHYMATRSDGVQTVVFLGFHIVLRPTGWIDFYKSLLRLAL